MHWTCRPAALLLVAAVLSGCGSTPGTPRTSAPSPTAAPPTASAVTSPPASVEPEPTAVPGGQTVSPGPPVTRIPTTQTDWGEILDALPDDFPRFPGAKDALLPPEPVSAALVADASVDEVAGWYRDALDALGYATLDLSEPLEDGSRVLDSQGDLPECRIQSTFRPAGESTMITVLFAAGCAGIGG